MDPLRSAGHVVWGGTDCNFNRVANCAHSQPLALSGIKPGPDYTDFFGLSAATLPDGFGHMVRARVVPLDYDPQQVAVAWAEPGEPGLILYDIARPGPACPASLGLGVGRCLFDMFVVSPWQDAISGKDPLTRGLGIVGALGELGLIARLAGRAGGFAALSARLREGKGLLGMRGAGGGVSLADDLLKSRVAKVLADCQFCFPAGTAVAVPGGAVAIETLRKGDTVLAEDPATGTIEPEPVQARIVRSASPLLSVLLSDGSSLRVTATHPFYVESDGDGGGGWVVAGRLRPGDRLRTATGKRVEVAAVRWNVGDAVVYTLTVARDHTFFVGSARVLVHNSGAGPACEVVFEDTYTAGTTHVAQAHEIQNATDYGEFEGGGVFRLYGNNNPAAPPNFGTSPGADGEFRPWGQSGFYPVSLKELRTPRVVNIGREIRDNADRIMEHTPTHAGPTVLYADVQFPAADVAGYINADNANTLARRAGGESNATAARFTQAPFFGAYSKIVLKAQGGVVVVDASGVHIR